MNFDRIQQFFKYGFLLQIISGSLSYAELASTIEWQPGAVVASGEAYICPRSFFYQANSTPCVTRKYKIYRQFIKKTSEGYLVQEFYNSDKKSTSPFLLVNKEDVTRFSPNYDYADQANTSIQGDYEHWYFNGQLQQKGQYNKLGKRTGRWTSWYENGQKRDEGYFRHGNHEGLWKSWTETGKLYAEQYINNGLPEMYHSNDLIETPGKLWVEWYPNGRMKSVGSIIEGKREGLWQFKDNEGLIEAEGYFKEGKRNGMWKTFWLRKRKMVPKQRNPNHFIYVLEEPPPKSEGKYQDGKRFGKWLFWDKEGNQTEKLYD